MKVATLPEAAALPVVGLGARLADYVELIRPRISLLVLFTVGAGAFLASSGHPDPMQLLHAVLGTALVAAGASAINQFLERNTDGLMSRTENRPLPAGRLPASEVLAIGIGLTVGGLVYMVLTLWHPLAAGIAAFTFASYVFLYTPLKRKTTLNTLIGAVPGALPPVIGWTAMRGHLDMQALALFLIVFVWQVPHFLAIAWIYRDQYARAGLCMLPVNDPDGMRTSRQMVRYCMVLIPASLLPALLGMAGLLYFVFVVVLGIGFLRSTLAFASDSSTPQARRVLRASLIYLPLLFLLLLLDGYTNSIALAIWQ